MGENIFKLVCSCYDAFMTEFFGQEIKEVEYPLNSKDKWGAKDEALALMKALRFGDVRPSTLEKQTSDFTRLQAVKEMFEDFGFFDPKLKHGEELIPLA